MYKDVSLAFAGLNNSALLLTVDYATQVKMGLESHKELNYDKENSCYAGQPVYAS